MEDKKAEVRKRRAAAKVAKLKAKEEAEATKVAKPRKRKAKKTEAETVAEAGVAVKESVEAKPRKRRAKKAEGAVDTAAENKPATPRKRKAKTAAKKTATKTAAKKAPAKQTTGKTVKPAKKHACMRGGKKIYTISALVAVHLHKGTKLEDIVTDVRNVFPESRFNLHSARVYRSQFRRFTEAVA